MEAVTLSASSRGQLKTSRNGCLSISLRHAYAYWVNEFFHFPLDMPHSSSGMAGPSIADLEAAALSVVHLLQGVAELANVRIALVGDLAVRKYLAEPRPCEVCRRYGNLVDRRLLIEMSEHRIRHQGVARVRKEDPFVLCQGEEGYYRERSGLILQASHRLDS